MKKFRNTTNFHNIFTTLIFLVETDLRINITNFHNIFTTLIFLVETDLRINTINFHNIFTTLIFLVETDLRIDIFYFYFDQQCIDTLIYCKNIVKFCDITQTTIPTLNNEPNTI